ncbi:MAG: DNA/RNA non-specific endonuclease [Candidatus Faecisoma sp.]|nr:DNA/RNA non-specific endonuclease [Acholeplasma sp.]MDY2892648.1 DNA/RNA non-specific endonuclease [Candidatus Faecisoma sp.]
MNRRVVEAFILLIILISSTIINKPTNYYGVNDVPDYNKEIYVTINNNVSTFNEINYNETYSKLDRLGRAGSAYSVISKNSLPTIERGSIGGVKPSGWHTVKYDIVDGKYLYNRCHLIGYQLSGNNSKENLITCTRNMNINGMLPFENKVAEYVKKTGNRVMYRVTPIYKNDNLLANGVQIEAKAIEDEKFDFNVYIYNVQDGIEINYENGESRVSE